MRGPGAPASLLFRLIIPVTAVFIVTVLSLIAVLFGDQRAPIAQFLDKYGNTLLLWEFVIVMVLSFLAMAWDRRQILKAMRERDSSPESASPGEAQ